MNLIDLLQWIAILLLGFMYFNAKKSIKEIYMENFPLIVCLYICRELKISNSELNTLIKTAEDLEMFKHYKLDKE